MQISTEICIFALRFENNRKENNMANSKTKEEVREENVVATVSNTEKFLHENKKVIIGAVVAVLVIAVGIFAYNKLIYAPASIEAAEECSAAEFSFQAREFELALNGDENHSGFAQVIEDYGSKAPKSAYLYAAVCCAQLGEWDQALSYARSYKGKDSILAARAIALQGDCHWALGNLEEAVKAYEKAAARADNDFAAAYLQKAGEVYLALGLNYKALAAFKSVKEKYPRSEEAYEIDKYINKAAE